MVHSFTNGAGADQPNTDLVLAPDGFFYGTTYFGAPGGSDRWTGYGTLYRVRPDGSGYRTLHYFSGGVDGAHPSAKLLIGRDGALYGATRGVEGGAAPYGTLFRLSPKGEIKVIHTFSGTDGGLVTGELVQDEEGVLYGAAQTGGSAQWYGTLFRLMPDGSGFQVIYDFPGGLVGGSVRGGLTLARDGRLYGASQYGGGADDGILFSIARDGSGYKKLHEFASIIGEGKRPMSKLVQAPDGSFYGTTDMGGARCNCGTIYRVDARGHYRTLYRFSDDIEGAGPSGQLVRGPNGNVFGNTFTGGAAVFYGTAYEIDAKTGKLVGLVPYDTSVWNVGTSFTTGPDGQFYAAGLEGGVFGGGAIFKLDPTAFAAP